ncbi:MAG: cytidylate kinase-like family protein [Gemmataceae bacterium]
MAQQPPSRRVGEGLDRASRHWRSLAGTGWTIAISRQAGADGPAIARAVGERLGWLVYDRELVDVIAYDMGLRTKLVESVDEKRPGWLASLMQAIGSPDITPSDYARHLKYVLTGLAGCGECVIVGRGAAQILPRTTTLRVRLVAPEDSRVGAIQQRFDLTEQEARRWVEKADWERERFVQTHFHRDVNDASLYDLVLTTSRLGVAGCADLIVAALEQLQGAAEASTVPLREPEATAP